MQNFDDNIWYAVNQTRVLLEPDAALETFGQSKIRYRIVCEALDQVGVTKIREGLLVSEKPLIISPSQYADEILEGFGEKAREYADWLTSHGRLVKILQYGLHIRKEAISESTVNEYLEPVLGRILEQARKEKELNTVIHGVENMWEVSLLKFMQLYTQRSAPVNFQDIHAHQVNASRQIQRDQIHSIEENFFQAQGDKQLMLALGQKLQALGRFDEFEDRFYALLRECQ